MIVIAGLIACPLAFLVMHSWLNGYAYRISINLYPFAITLILLTLLTILLITLQTIKTALRSPVKSLRTA
jgi:putative ABC transport system permease protein